MTEILCIAATIIFGFIAYGFRRRSRFWFGVGEIIIAFIQIHLARIPTYDFLVTQGTNRFAELFYKTTPVILAIYLLVRGLDNIGEDLPRQWRRTWSKLFGPIGKSGRDNTVS
jgi:hypothetical protein